MILDLIVRYNIRVPIIHIKDNLYLIGHQRCSILLKSDVVIVRVGGGQDKFEDYVPLNHRIFERQLVLSMINSNESLEWVIDRLVNGNKIRGGNYLPPQEIDITPRLSSSPVRKSRTSVSPGPRSQRGDQKRPKTLLKSYRGPQV